MRTLRIIFPLFLLLSCSAAPRQGTLTPIEYTHDGTTRTAWASQPASKNIPGQPVVLILTPDLRLKQMRETVSGKIPFLEIFDQYLNNAGISLVRFEQQGRKAASTKNVLQESQSLIRVLKKSNRHITLLTFGSAALPGLQLAEKDSELQLVMVGPPAREYRKVLRWRFLEEPSRHFSDCFDIDGNGRVTRDEFNRDIYHVRNEFYRGLTFRQLDRDNNGIITATDFNIANKQRFVLLESALFGKTETAQAAALLGPEESLAWAASLVKAGSSVENTLRRLTRPVYIIHGGDDRHIPASESRLLDARRYPNLSVHIEGGHDNELNWKEYQRTGTVPKGLFHLFQRLFRCAGVSDAGE